MDISAKLDYACKALLELSMNWPNNHPVQIQVIADHQKIPMNFLMQILLLLKQHGYVSSVRGKNGGYVLAIEPKKILLSEIVEAFTNGNVNEFTTDDSHVMSGVWKEIDQKLCHALKAYNFQMLVDRQRTQNQVVDFEI